MGNVLNSNTAFNSDMFYGSGSAKITE